MSVHVKVKQSAKDCRIHKR